MIQILEKKCQQGVFYRKGYLLVVNSFPLYIV